MQIHNTDALYIILDIFNCNLPHLSRKKDISLTIRGFTMAVFTSDVLRFTSG